MHIRSKFFFVLPLGVTYFYLNVKVNLFEIKLDKGPSTSPINNDFIKEAI
jgi:hypothetical protein